MVYAQFLPDDDKLSQKLSYKVTFQKVFCMLSYNPTKHHTIDLTNPYCGIGREMKRLNEGFPLIIKKEIHGHVYRPRKLVGPLMILVLSHSPSSLREKVSYEVTLSPLVNMSVIRSAEATYGVEMYPVIMR